jgi:Copper amine oxidase N-terminal domain
MKKLIVAVMLCLALLTGMIVMTPAPAVKAQSTTDSSQWFDNLDYQKSAELRVVLDGKQLVFDVNPQVVNSRTLVPMRAIFEAFGLTVSWDENTNTVKGTSADTTILFTIGSNKAMVNDQERVLDVPASVIDNRTMIPLRFLSENMGYNVVWIGSSNLILISKSDIIEWRYESFEAVPPYKEYERKYVNGLMAAETRYNGKNHDVKMVTLYHLDGRLVPNVPDFTIPQYGTGWYQQSPFAGKTYWIDIDAVMGSNGNSLFYDPNNFALIKANILRDSAPAGNYVKVKVDEHYFALDTWNIMSGSASTFAAIQEESQLDGKVINRQDTIFRVIINDRYSGLILAGNLVGSLLEPQPNQIYTILEKDPRTLFNWPDSTWSRLKGETPWAGMSSEMLLVQMQTKPDQTTRTVTRFSTLELWVYEYEYADSIYFFDDGILISRW